MPVSFAGWSVKAKVQNRRARVADAARYRTARMAAFATRAPSDSEDRGQRSVIRRDRTIHHPAARKSRRGKEGARANPPPQAGEENEAV